MQNDETVAAKHYHLQTKHTPASIQANRHRLDWANQPALFKEYIGLDTISLPDTLPSTGVQTFQAVAGTSRLALPAKRQRNDVPSLAQIAHVLYYSAGLTKKLVLPQGDTYFRAAPCAGALYPIEVYVVAGDLPGIAPGVYHFDPRSFALAQLRAGNFLGVVSDASGGEPDVVRAPAVLVFTAITWRSSWKYQARAYRYHFWDAGTMASQCLAAGTALGLPVSIVAGFADQEIEQLLGIDGVIEKTICLVTVGRSENLTPRPGGQVPEIHPKDLSISATAVPEPLAEALHAASSLADRASVNAWREAGHLPVPATNLVEKRWPAEPIPASRWPEAGFEQTVLRRGSARRFLQEAIRFGELSSLLAIAFQPFSADWLRPGENLLNRPYLSVHAVDGLPPGAYRYGTAGPSFQQLRPGRFRGDSAALCLGQRLGGDASATVYFLSDLDAVLGRYGNRGYRLAQLEAGILGGRLYLLAYAMGRGATGLTFFDDLVVNFFAPPAAGQETRFVVSCGVPAPRGGPPSRMVRLQPGGAAV